MPNPGNNRLPVVVVVTTATSLSSPLVAITTTTGGINNRGTINNIITRVTITAACGGLPTRPIIPNTRNPAFGETITRILRYPTFRLTHPFPLETRVNIQRPVMVVVVVVVAEETLDSPSFPYNQATPVFHTGAVSGPVEVPWVVHLVTMI